MKKVGNIVSNKTYNPENKRPPVSVDADEADSQMERYIRAKYMNNGLAKAKRQNTGGSESDTPPPLPPKTGGRFGFRSASSIFPLGSKAKKQAQHDSVSSSPRDHTLHRNKPSQVFGASVGYNAGSTGEDTETKLRKLRDMGFTDDQRNALILKGVNGNLEQAIEALVRLGEGDGRASASLVSPRESSLSASQLFTTAKSASLGSTRPTSATATSDNPFDMLDMPPALPQSSQSTGTLQNKNPYMSSNPFGMPAQQTAAALDQSFLGLSLAPPSQTLFPNHTGGAPIPQQQPNVMQQQMYQQAPSVAPVPQGYGAITYSDIPNHQQPAQASYNPFFNSQQPPQQVQLQQQQQPPPLMVNTLTGSGGYGSNPFTRSPTRIQSPTLTQIPEQSQQNFYNPSPLQNEYTSSSQPQQSYYNAAPPQPQPQQQNYYSSSPQPPQQQWQTLPQQQQQQQPLQPQHTNNPFAMPQQRPVPQTQRPDNASIMALYALSPAPATAPTQPQQPQQQAPPQQLSAFDQMFGQPAPQQAAPQQVATSTASKNPFLGTNTGPRTDQGGMTANPSYKHNVSRDSMMALGMEWSNGRHSPDAFASLSARQ